MNIFSGSFHNLEPFRPEVHVAPGLVSSKAPYLVGLIETEHPEIIICAGSLLNYRWVLSLASCTAEKKHDKKRFKVGIYTPCKISTTKKLSRLWHQDLMMDHTLSSQSKR